MDLLVDIGNSTCKFAISKNDTILFGGKSNSPAELIDLIAGYAEQVAAEQVAVEQVASEQVAVEQVASKQASAEQEPVPSSSKFENVVLCTVRNVDNDFLEKLAHFGSKFIQVNGDFMQKCIASGEPYPKIFNTLRHDFGADRIAAVVGALSLYPNSKLLVIDMGTAVTYDLIDGDRYIGGAISMGLNTRYRALGLLTDKIPTFSPFDRLSKQNVGQIPAVGNDTSDHLAAGNIVGLKFELQGFIDRFKEYRTIMTGGDAKFFIEALGRPVEYIPDLTFRGLVAILCQTY